MQKNQANVLRAITEFLPTACERMEAGFYFEEGGCFGMALALHAAFTEVGRFPQYAIDDSYVHAMVVVDSAYYDYSGRVHSTKKRRIVSDSEFLEFALLCGHGDESIFSDQSYAAATLQLAVSMCEVASSSSTALGQKF